MQASHTDSAVNLTGVARACGIEQVFDITDEATLRRLAELVHGAETTLFARVAIRAPSTRLLALRPTRCTDEGLPPARKASTTASNAAGRSGLVALWSRYANATMIEKP